MDVIEYLINAPHKGETFLFIIAIIIGTQFIVKLWDWFIQRFEIETKSTKREKLQVQSINQLETNVQNLISDQEKIKNALEKLGAELNNMQDKQDAANRARIRDRIGQAYRYYSDKGQWTSMEKEAFDGLITSYEEAGGTNSFIHTTCQPKSSEWKIVE